MSHGRLEFLPKQYNYSLSFTKCELSIAHPALSLAPKHVVSINWCCIVIFVDNASDQDFDPSSNIYLLFSLLRFTLTFQDIFCRNTPLPSKRLFNQVMLGLSMSDAIVYSINIVSMWLCPKPIVRRIFHCMI